VIKTHSIAAGKDEDVSGVSIQIRQVSKTFGEDSDAPFLALKEVNLDIQPGEFISVVGPSGCGKSTLMLMVAGLLKRSQGDVIVDGQPVTKPITDVGIAFQDHLLLDFRTAMKNVTLQADIRGLDKKKIETRARELFEQLRLTHAMDKYPRQLSGGMRQRVSLVRTLVHDPSVILMDEPFGALDALTRLQVRMDLEALWLRRRPTVLFITHSVEEAVGLSDRIFVMSPSPGEVVDEIKVELPRPRPIVLGDAPEFAAYVDRIYGHFERMGVLHGIEVPKANPGEK
jgi:NitT/TauT family transport system ATP-binding protein